MIPSESLTNDDIMRIYQEAKNVMQQPEPIQEELRGSDFKPERDSQRLGASYKRVAEFMKDGLWHTPENISEASQTRIDSTLRFVRMMRRYGWKIEKEYIAAGLYRYRAIWLR